MPHAEPRTSGFTLIEVVIALAVLALALAAIIQASSTAARHVAYLQDKTFAHWVAQNRLNEMRLNREWPTPGSTEGSERMAERAWRWEVNVSNTPEGQLRRVDVRVRHEEDPEGTSVAFLTGFLREPQPDTPTSTTPTDTPTTETPAPPVVDGQPVTGEPATTPAVNR